jgi:hypothetical protein
MLARSPFSLSVAFFAGCRLAPRPPNTPREPVGPSTAVSGETLSFTTSTTDSDGDSVALHFAWGDRDTSLWSRFVASGESVTASRAIQPLSAMTGYKEIYGRLTWRRSGSKGRGD